ncbi:MAG: RDD family protein [Candidatus Nanopelagicales bacterium]
MTIWDGDGTASAPDPRPHTAAVPPSRRELVSSVLLTVAISVGIGLIATILIGVVLTFFDIANTDPTADYQTQTGLPPVVFAGALVAVLVIVWLVACRAGVGAPGDAIMNLLTLDTDGHASGKGAILARAAIPVVVFGVLALMGRPGLGLVVLLVLWAPAFLRSDRRSAVDLLVGVVPHSTAARRDAQPHPWAR